MSFDEACRQLGLSQAELEALVAAGEISSVKEGDTMFFKADAVAKYQASKGEDTILLADDEIPILESDDIDEIDLLSLDDDLAPTTPVETTPSLGAAIEEKTDDIVSGVDGAVEEISLDMGDDLPEIDLGLDIDDPTEELVAAAPATSDAADETLLNIDGLLEEEAETTTPIAAAGDFGDDLLDLDSGDDTLLDTELDFGDETDTFEVDTVDDLGDVTEEATLLRGGGARVMQMKRKESHAVMSVVLALSAALLLLPLAVMINTIFMSSGGAEVASAPGANDFAWIKDYNVLSGGFDWVADIFKSK